MKKRGKKLAAAAKLETVAYKPPKPSLSLHGKHAERLAKHRVGGTVRAALRGKLIRHEIRREDYGPEAGKVRHHAEIEVHDLKCS